MRLTLKLGLGVGALAAVTAVALAPLACGVREPRISYPAIGKTFTVLPAVVNFSGPPKAPQGSLKAVHLTVNWGGGPIERADHPVLNFYKGYGDQRVLAASFKWEDLKKKYKTSGCTNDQIETLDGPDYGTALVCDGSLQMDEYTYIEGLDDEKEPHVATSWATYRFSDNDSVLGVSIQLLEQ